MIAIGIDPGLTGAVAIFNGGTDVYVVHDTPTSYTLNARGKRRGIYNIGAMFKLLGLPGIEPRHVIVAIEQQQAFPGRKTTRYCSRCQHGMTVTVSQGAAATFSTGRGMGIWEALVVARGYAYELVRPRVWKDRMLQGLDPGKKASSLVIARRLFPGADLGRAKDAGRAEALLIAAYAMKHHMRGAA